MNNHRLDVIGELALYRPDRAINGHERLHRIAATLDEPDIAIELPQLRDDIPKSACEIRHRTQGTIRVRTTRNPMKGRRAPGSAPPRMAARMFWSGSAYDPPRITQSASVSRSILFVGSYG